MLIRSIDLFTHSHGGNRNQLGHVTLMWLLGSLESEWHPRGTRKLTFRHYRPCPFSYKLQFQVVGPEVKGVDLWP